MLSTKSLICSCSSTGDSVESVILSLVWPFVESPDCCRLLDSLLLTFFLAAWVNVDDEEMALAE